MELGPHGAGALALRRPTAALPEVTLGSALGPRFLEPPDASGRTLSGTSAASTSQSGTCRTGRCPSRPCAQCMAAYTRTAPAPPQGVPSRKASFASGKLYVTVMGTKVKRSSLHQRRRLGEPITLCDQGVPSPAEQNRHENGDAGPLERAVPSLRGNAFRLGCHLLLMAANPWSGLSQRASETTAWQPLHPFGMPRWWPFGPESGPLALDLFSLRLMRAASGLPDSGLGKSRQGQPRDRPVHGGRGAV